MVVELVVELVELQVLLVLIDTYYLFSDLSFKVLMNLTTSRWPALKYTVLVSSAKLGDFSGNTSFNILTKSTASTGITKSSDSFIFYSSKKGTLVKQ